MCLNLYLSNQIPIKTIAVKNESNGLELSYFLFEKKFRYDKQTVYSQFTSPITGKLYEYKFWKSFGGYMVEEHSCLQQIIIHMSFADYSCSSNIDAYLGFHCNAFSRKCIATERQSDGMFINWLPILVGLDDIQLAGDTDVVVKQFIIPDPKHLKGHIPDEQLNEYTKWYTKWDKYMQEKI